MKPIIAASVLVLAAAMPAQANIAPSDEHVVTGAEFYRHCGHPLGYRAVITCQLAVSNVADFLRVKSYACFEPQTTPQLLNSVATRWVQTHWANDDHPAALMVGNGLIASFPCRPGPQPQFDYSKARERVDFLASVLRFFAAINSL